jgi:hypothetical protein
MSEFDRAQATGMAALHCTLAKMDGHQLDKKCMRYNAMADYMEVCGTDYRKGISEAVETAIIGNEMHTGEAFDRRAYKWMIGGDA